MRWLAWTYTLFALAAAPLAAQTPRHPSEQILAAARDLAHQPAHVRPYLRYLDLRTIPAVQRPDAWRAITGHVNQLSREPDIDPSRVVVLPGTQVSMIRLNMLDYGWSVELWESLAKVDPFFHVQAFEPTTKKRDILLAPWLSPSEECKKSLAYLVQETQSQVPIVDGPWFANQTLAQKNRRPGYYDFVSGKLGGIKTEKDFQKIIGYHRELARDFGGPLRAAVARSGVSTEPRAIARLPTIGGGYWYTLDFDTANGVKNPLENVGDDIENHFDASEEGAHLANGFFLWFLADSKGNAQDSAPDFVGKDSTSPSNDGRIHVVISCIRCHGKGGLRSINDWVRNLIAAPLSANLIVKDKKYPSVRHFQRQYTRRLEQYLDRDKAVYESAVKLATGWDSGTFAEKISWLWAFTEYADVDLARAAVDVGTTPQRLKAALKKATDSGAGDQVLSVYILEGERAQTLPIRSWWESLPRAHEIMFRYGGEK